MSSVTFDRDTQHKSVLAKLLATENINVIQKKMETAAFDLKTRTLYCPIWEAMDGDMYDLLMGHEVGHALYTPEAGWHDAIDKKNAIGVSKSILNVVEDARIEKLMKRKYPGLSRPMLRAYKQLFERDFFGIKKLSDLSKLNFADRLNMHFKLGAFATIPFSEAERQIVAEIDRAESWDDVVAISKKVQESMKEDEKQDQQQDKIESLDDLIDAINQEEQEDLGGDSESDSESSDDDQEESENGNMEGEGEGEDDDDENDGDTDTDSDSSEDSDTDSGDDGEADPTGLEKLREQIGDNEEPQALTDQIFRAREGELVVDDLQVVTLDFPVANLDKVIDPITDHLDRFKVYVNQFRREYYANMLLQQHRRFNKNNDKFIQQLVKQFMMKRNASQYARQLEARSGELDMTKLHKYRFTNDIFAKIKVVPKGKSHGLVVFIDMSGSMNEILGSTFEQLLILGTFCKRVNIPFDFYGFSDTSTTRHNTKQKFVSKNVVFSGGSFHLKHLLSSSFTPKIYKAAFDMLLNVSYHKAGYVDGNPVLPPSYAGFDLNGTPLVQTIVAARSVLDQFKETHKLDVVNAMYLTDGDSTDEPQVIKDDMSRSSFAYINNKYEKVKRIVKIVDSKTKVAMTVSASDDYLSAQQLFTMMVQKITGCVNIGFYIGKSQTIKYRMRRDADGVDAITRRAMTQSLRENKFYASNNQGFASYFNVCVRSENINEDSYTVTATNTLDKKAVKKLTTEFSKNQNDKKSDRIFTSKLMDFLC